MVLSGDGGSDAAFAGLTCAGGKEAVGGALSGVSVGGIEDGGGNLPVEEAGILGRRPVAVGLATDESRTTILPTPLFLIGGSCVVGAFPVAPLEGGGGTFPD